MRTIPWTRSITAAVVAALLTGCGSDGPELATVEGTVLLGGRPLDGATVVFTPTAGGRPAAAVTDADGSFELTYTEDRAGALPGEHIVTVSTYRKADPDSDRIGAPERVPAQYNVRTELKRTVDADENAIDFDLLATGRIVEPR